VRLIAGALIAALVPGHAFAQTVDAFTCGSFQAQAWRTSSASGPLTHWTVARGSEKTTEQGLLRGAPRFECLDTTLILEITFAAGNGTLSIYFPDGSDLTYGRQQVERRGGRYVLPIQAKLRISPAFRAAFDYHCRLEMPIDPIPASSRADCLF
jgi:hypothetical protein